MKNESLFFKPEFDPEINPIDYFNLHKFDYFVSEILKKKFKDIKEVKPNSYVILNAIKPISVIYTGSVFVFDQSINGVAANKPYTPFMLFSKFNFNSNNYAAYIHVSSQIMGKKLPFIRVGGDYFKVIKNIDRFDIERKELKRWKKDDLKDDFGKDIIKYIDKFDNFILKPDNKNHCQTVGNLYNLYNQFSHKPKSGDITWSKRILEHIFGEQYDLGLRYLQILYLYPQQILPILVLASRTRETGKSTFLDWMSIIFGANMVIINPADITSQFNSSYGLANIIGIEETVSDKSSTVEKLKALSTTKFINMNQKFIDNYKVPFFGKFIITTNDERKFMKVEDDEIRFWVKVVGKPKFKNTAILTDLINEIPALLQTLEELPVPDFTRSRMVFTAEEIRTDSLDRVKKESMPELYKEIFERFAHFFFNSNYDEVYCHHLDIKNKWFLSNNNISSSYIRTIIKENFKLKPEETIYYSPFNESPTKTVNRPFLFKKSMFINENQELKNYEELPF